MKNYLAAMGFVFASAVFGAAYGQTVTDGVAGAAGDVPTKVLYLSGKGKDDGVPWKFVCSTGMKAGVESTILVPSNWELQGFGTFTYGYEHRGSAGKPGAPIVGVEGHYSRTFTGPGGSGERTFLVFEGVMTDTTAMINGQSVGPKHQGGFYRFKYEVTSLIKAGQENQLDVIVDDESANASVNNAERRGDFFNYGGIYRPVYLETVPSEFIDRVAVDAKADGSFKEDVYTDGAASGETVEGQFFDVKGNAIGEAFSAAVGADGKAHLESTMTDPKLWNAETPNLYTVDVRLKKAGGAVVHSKLQRFGFRTMEVRDGDGLYVNGKRIMLKGADRHSFWPDSGRCLSDAISIADIRLMQEMNMNAVRMSHYPPDQHFLDECDAMGMYVLDEVTGWHGAYDDTVGHKVVQEMVTRDVNHPCVLFWDNGNESGWNTNLDADYDKYDPQNRHVLHPWAIFDHVDTKHYPDFKTVSDKANGPNVFFPTEMLHGLYDGGAGAGLQEYWDVIRKGKVGSGGFIWAFLDEAPKRVDLDGHLDTRGNLAPDGIVGPYREKEGSFYTIKELWAPVVITNKEVPADLKFEVENRYSFTNLKDCRFLYQLRKYHGPEDKSKEFIPTMVQTSQASFISTAQAESPDVGPGEKGVLSLTMLNYEKADALAIIMLDPKGKEIFTRIFPLAGLDSYRALTSAPVMANGITSVSDNLESVTVSGVNGLKLTFSKATGYLASVENGGKSFSLTNGPRLVSGEAKLVSIHGEYHTQGDVVATVTATYSGDLKSVVWSVHQNGWVDVEAAYTRNGPTDFVGVGFDFPEKSVKSIRYLGKGPYRMYENRTAGPTLNVWENEYNDAETGSIPWRYPEFKGYFGDVRWARYETAEGAMTFLVDQQAGGAGMYLQNFVPSFPDKSLVGKTQVPYPETSIGFLQLIPPVGTKFGTASTMGPGSQQPVASGDYKVKVSMYFGEFSGK